MSRRRTVSMLTLKAWRDTLVHKGQFVSLILLVALGIMSYVTFQNGYYDLSGSLDSTYRRLALPDFAVRVERAPLAAARQVASLPGVAAARVRRISDVGLDLAEGRQATARIISIGDGSSGGVGRPAVIEGRLPVPGAAGEAMLDPKFSGETGLGVGDRIDLRIGGERETVRVVGIGADPEYLYALRTQGDLPSPGEFAVVLVSDREAERLFGTAAGNDVAVRVTPGARIASVIDDVEHELRPYAVLETRERTEMPSYEALQSEVDQNRVMAQTMPALVLLISSMSLFIALSRLVTAQRGEIGLAKALGYTDAQILGHYLSFGLIIAGGGSIIGIALGLLGARGVASSYVSILGIPYLESGFYLDVVAVAVLLAVGACSAAAIVPAWSSARLAPAIAMHSDPNKSLAGGRVPLAEKLLSPVLPRSFTFRIPLRNVFRARRRSLYTVLGIAFAMVLSVMTVSMFDSMDYLLDTAFTKTERWDVSAFFDVPQGSARLAEIRGIDGVNRVQPALVIPATLERNGIEEDLVLTAMAPGADFHGFDPMPGSDPQSALAAGDLVIAAGTATALGVGPGAVVYVDTPFLDDPVTMRVGAVAKEMLGTPAFVSFDAASQLTGSAVTEHNAFYLDVEPTLATRIQDEIFDMPGAATVQVKAGLIERLKSLLELFNVFGSVMLAFGFAMAFVVIYTTFTANVNERTREIATMRVIGEDNPRLTVMVTLENLLIALAALPLGVWLGVLATQAIFARFSTDAYSLEAYIYPSSVAQVCGLMLLVLLVSETPPVRRIFRLDLAEATKVME